MNTMAKNYCTAVVGGVEIEVVDPALFHAQPVGTRGLGLFCRVDLAVGDIWWAHDLGDPRFVTQVIPWDEHMSSRSVARAEIEKVCYVDPRLQSLVVCTEPFCRVNHASDEGANSCCDPLGNSRVTRPIPAGTEILIPYEYEAVVSLLWKFPDLARLLPPGAWQDHRFLLQSITEWPVAMHFLRSL